MTAEFIVAVHALEFLNHRKAFLSSEEIAKNVCTNPARIRKILAKLEQAGLLSARNGHCGGYAFEGDPEKVTLSQVLRAMEMRCIRLTWRSGDLDMDCAVASGMAEVMDGILEEAEAGCLTALDKITLAEVDRRLFAQKKGEP